jgi:zinc protease
MVHSFRVANISVALSSLLLAASCVGTPAPATVESAPTVMARPTALPGGSVYALDELLPLAPELTKKTMDNGLTYYVRRNGNPGGRAVMFLVIASGSTNERDDQAGYAHFVEHMAFNGTKSFPENELVGYLRSIGMDFGAEINAHTTREETLYTLSMPLNNPEFFDTGLKVLREWATEVSFDPHEVEKEKGVIIEEMRLGLGPDETARVREVHGLLEDSAHADREPIGYEASIQAATAEGLKEFYDEHYRPDRMAIIIVGDIDPVEVAEKIEGEFSFPSKDGLVRARPTFPVEPSTKLGFELTLDPGFDRSIITYRKIVPYTPETKIGDYSILLKLRIAAEAIRLRLSDLSRSGGTAWRDAYFDDDYFYGRTRLYSFTLTAAPGKELSAFDALSAEVERIRRYGFTESEFRRTVDMYRRWLGSLDVEDEDLKSVNFAEEYVRNFMYGEPVPGVVNERVYIRDTLEALTLEGLNETGSLILSADEGFVAVRAKPDSGTKTLVEADFAETLRQARQASLEPPAETGDDSGLFDGLPAPGTIVAEEKLTGGITRLTLSNGATVLLKPTDYDRDAISFLAWSPGGYSAMPVKDQTAASFAPSLMSAVGLGTMSATRLDEVTAGLNTGLQWSIGENAEVFAGKTTPTDLEAFLRLVYLSSSEPGRDARAFEAARDRLAEDIEPYVRDPEYRFESAWSQDLFGGNPRVAPLDAASTKALEFEATRELVLSALSDASEFTYVLVGDFDLEATKDLVARHIGAIPSGEADEPEWIEPLVPRQGGGRVDYAFSTENRASVRIVWAALSPWSWEREATLEVMASAINNRLLDALREDLGGTYVVSTRSAFSRQPAEQYSLVVQFDTSPDRVDELVSEVRAEVSKLAEGSSDPKYASQIKTAAQRDYNGRGRTNDFWVNRIGHALMNGLDFQVLERAKTAVGFADAAAFRQLAAELITADREFVYIMLPD